MRNKARSSLSLLDSCIELIPNSAPYTDSYQPAYQPILCPRNNNNTANGPACHLTTPYKPHSPLQYILSIPYHTIPTAADLLPNLSAYLIPACPSPVHNQDQVTSNSTHITHTQSSSLLPFQLQPHPSIHPAFGRAPTGLPKLL